MWYLHTQPPLFNLLIGSTLRWSPLPDALSLQLLMLAASLTIVVGLQRLLVRLGLGPAWAFGLAVFVSSDPELMRYELGATYEVVVAALVVVCLLLAARFFERPGRGRFAAFTAALAVTALTRSLFHPVWVAALVAIVLWTTRGRWTWRGLAVGLAIPILAIGAWVGKNEVLFGRATLSSWLGMNLQRGVVSPLPMEDLDAMIAEGAISGASGVAPFSSYESYLGTVPDCTPSHDNPAVSLPARANGVPNFNYECYLPIYAQLSRDARAVAREHPGVLMDGRVWALEQTIARSSNAATARDPMFRHLEGLYHVLLLDVGARLDMSDWSFPLNPALYLPARLSIVVGGLLATNLVLLVVSGIAVIRRRADEPMVLVALSSFTVVFAVATGLLELGENARFRTTINPLCIGLTLGALVAFLLRWRRRATPVLVSPPASPSGTASAPQPAPRSPRP